MTEIDTEVESTEVVDPSVAELSKAYKVTLRDECTTNWNRGMIATEVLELHNQDKKKAILSKFLDSTGEGRSAFYQYAWVWGKYKDSKNRDLPGLSWTHYRIAAGTNDPEGWVEKAHDGKWGTKKLIDEISQVEVETKISTGVSCQECETQVEVKYSVIITMNRKRHFLCSADCGIEFLKKSQE